MSEAIVPCRFLQYPLKQFITTQKVIGNEMMFLYTISFQHGTVHDVAYVWATSMHDARCKVYSLRSSHVSIDQVGRHVEDQQQSTTTIVPTDPEDDPPPKRYA